MTSTVNKVATRKAKKKTTTRKPPRAFYGGAVVFHWHRWEDYCQELGISNKNIHEFYMGKKASAISKEVELYIMTEMLHDVINHRCISLYRCKNKDGVLSFGSPHIDKEITDYDRFKITFQSNLNIKGGGRNKWNVYSLIDMKRGTVLAKYADYPNNINLKDKSIMSVNSNRINRCYAHPISAIEKLLGGVGKHGY